MALDGITLAHLLAELSPQIVGARIDKVYQPEKAEIHLLLRQQGQSLRLLFSVQASSARLHLTPENKKNPLSPPMFCMILRKHLEGGRITKLEQSGFERTISLAVQTYNEYGDLVTLNLYLEIMGKHSNLILVDPASNLILDGLKRYSHALSRHREVLPGRPYLPPPSQGKLDLLESEDLFRACLDQGDLDATLASLLLTKLAGVSPELALELVTRAGLSAETRLHQCGDIDLSRVFQAYRQLTTPLTPLTSQPALYFSSADDPIPVAFSFTHYQQYQGFRLEQPTSLNETVRLFYQLKATDNSLESKRGSLLKIVHQQNSHLRKKLAIYEEVLESASTAVLYQKWGELLTANVYQIPARSSEVTVADYHLADLPLITIPLDPALSGIENAGRYYRKYNKAKAASLKTAPLKSIALVELQYLDSLTVSLEQALNLSDLEDIHSELIEQGYLARRPERSGSSKKNKSPKVESKPRSYHSSQGKLILVGKNNWQNDRLTLKTGKPQDLWLHVQNIPGSHVLIPLNEGEDFPDDQTLEEAAALAIYFSQARGSSSVPVDYTHVKHIKKPNGSKPGMVIYEKHWTLYLTPTSEILHPLFANEITT